MRASQRQHGAENVSVGFIVGVLTWKRDSAGDPRDAGILRKFRVALSDKLEANRGVPTFSSCVGDITNRTITALAPSLHATQTTIDVGGAYYHGTPDSVAEGGRIVYAHIPPWLVLCGAQYAARDARGRRRMLLIKGNMPGRSDAGRIWQRCFDLFLRGYGLRQLLSDRRVWVQSSERGDIIVHDHVDDSRLTTTTDAARSHFHAAWARAFNESPEEKPTTEDFTGLRHRVISPLVTEISCIGVTRRLETLLADFPLVGTEVCEYPIPGDALRRLRDPASDTNPLVPDLLEPAQRILGTAGFIVNAVRADAYFGCCVLSRYASVLRLTRYVWRLIVRLGHYLVKTGSMHLHVSAPRRLPSTPSGGPSRHDFTLDLFQAEVDSSHGNAEDGASYGGFLLLGACPCRQPGYTPGVGGAGGGALAWKSAAPREGDDSSGAAELRMSTICYKYILAMRLLQKDLQLGVAPAHPTPLYTDAQVVMDGTGCERLVKTSRWMATRYAMIRWGLSCGTIDLRKIRAEDNSADIVTKCLIGIRFARLRARVLGLHPPGGVL